MWLSVYITLVVLIFALIFWFKKYLRDIGVLEFFVGVVSLLGGIFGASLLLAFVQMMGLTETSFYSSITGPLLEELVKFGIVYFIIRVFQRELMNPLWGLAIGVLIGLGFGFYENLVYINSGVESLEVILYRSIFIGGLILHPLTTGVMGYMVFICNNIPEVLPGVFKESKKHFNKLYSVGGLLKYVYKNSGNSVLVLLNCIKKVLFLDITVKYILEGKNKKMSEHGHGPVEMLYEGLFLAVWIHVLYNTLLTLTTESSLFLSVVVVMISILLFNFFRQIFGSVLIASFIIIMMFVGVFFQNDFGEKILLLDLFMLIIILLFFSNIMEKKLNR